jgi:hypothetical protein
MVSVRMVQMPVDEVIDMIPVRNGFMTAARAMHVVCVVPPASVVGGTASRVGFVNVDRVLIDVVFVEVMEVTVVKVVHVITVLHGRMATIGPVLMAMFRVRFAGHDRAPVGWVIRWPSGAHALGPALGA